MLRCRNVLLGKRSHSAAAAFWHQLVSHRSAPSREPVPETLETYADFFPLRSISAPSTSSSVHPRSERSFPAEGDVRRAFAAVCQGGSFNFFNTIGPCRSPSPISQFPEADIVSQAASRPSSTPH